MKASKKYKAMSRAERRVAIAKDVIAAINAKKFGGVKSGNGFIIDRHGSFYGMIDAGTACHVAKRCTVCARGAMMLTRIAKYNEFDWRGYIDRGVTVLALEDAFNSDQLDLIEAAFERWSDSRTACQFGNDFYNDEDRLIAIMQNIIDHNGTFKPSVRYEMVTKC